YVYGMLYGEVWRALVKAGLDPYFGVMHGSERDQGSLVFDLIEEFRACGGERCRGAARVDDVASIVKSLLIDAIRYAAPRSGRSGDGCSSGA
ncbi:MAG: CRISPR-associated endonuclease Cas1, partial [Candidatus Rokubacteria bacterium]|nr:CRISPR-associated endonuclease Cas1 [Candidatus Rokubacteria bacterium]